jgi:hypothetical protein
VQRPTRAQGFGRIEMRGKQGEVAVAHAGHQRGQVATEHRHQVASGLGGKRRMLRRGAIAQLQGDHAAEDRGLGGRQGHVELRLGKAALDCGHYARRRGRSQVKPMQHGRPVAILGGSRIPFCRNNTAYFDLGNVGMSIKAVGSLVEKFNLSGVQLGEVALGAVLKHSSDWNIGREVALSAGLSPLTPGITMQRACGTSLDTSIHIGNKIALGQIEAGIAGGSDTTSDVPIVLGDKLRRRLLDRQSRQDLRSARRRGAQGFLAARIEAGLSGRGRTAHRQVDGRPLRDDGQGMGHHPRGAGPARLRIASQGRGRVRARLLQGSGGAVPRSGARQHPARRHHGRETGGAEARLRSQLGQGQPDRRQFDAADRRRQRGAARLRSLGAGTRTEAARLPHPFAQVAAVDFVARRRPADGTDRGRRRDAQARRA